MEVTDVVIVGAGPTGLTLSTALDRQGTRNIVLEKDVNIWPYPRAIRMGETGNRDLQNAGVTGDLYTKISSRYANHIRFMHGKEPDYFKTPFMTIDADYVGYTGHIGTTFVQPELEKSLREIIKSSKYSALKTGCTVTGIREDEQWVYVAYTNVDGSEGTVKAKFCAGADGKVGFTRKKYLEPKGVIMEESMPSNEIWIGLYWKVVAPTPQSHPDFPLWKLGYTPGKVIDSFIPSGFIMVSNPERVGIVATVGDPKEPGSLWHLEFEVQEGEDREELQKESKYKAIVEPYLTHSGARYGLSEDVQVQFPWDCLKLQVSFSYRFEARNCNIWHVGRTMLLGDAAHVFPPYAGQGCRVGMADAIGLAWRLRVALENDHKGQELFDHLFRKWRMERELDLDRALKATVRNAGLLRTKSPPQVGPAAPNGSGGPQRFNNGFSLDSYAYSAGLPFLPSGGDFLPQVYAVEVGSGDSTVRYTDDVIFGQKKGLFQLVHLVDAIEQIEEEDVKIPAAAAAFVADGEMTTIISDTTTSSNAKTKKRATYRVATGDEFLKSPLAVGRENVVSYDPLRLSKSFPGSRYLIVRADFLVYAKCGSREETVDVFKDLSEVIIGTANEV